MAGTELDKYIAAEIAKYKGVAFPLKSGPLRRALIKRTDCKKLHPNPADEFSMPEVGPNYSIISKYERQLINADVDKYFDHDPLIVERMYPDGYMILNGHHRWAAALRTKSPAIAINIVNLTQEEDIEKMIAKGKNDKRITLDLDEVVFATDEDDEIDIEQGLRFPFDHFYKERLRTGIPALFNFFKLQGYDIWVYTSHYYSMEHLAGLFKRYHARVTGVVTGTARPGGSATKQVQENIKKLIAQKYRYTLHIDKNMVLQTYSGTGEFNEYEIKLQGSNWSGAIMKIVSEQIKDGNEE